MLPISVIIPNYNHGGYVEQCLRSVSEGGEQPQEIILVDNASTDRSVQIAEELQLPNLLIIRNDRNVGATAARHIGMQRASCEMFSFLDSDDWLGAGALASAYAKLRDQNLDGSLFTMFRMSEDRKTKLFTLEPPKEIISGLQAFEMTLGTWQIDARGVYRKHLYERAFQRFVPSGHADDEVLARLVFLEAKRLSGTTGVYHYRLVEKAPSLQMVIGQVRTNLHVLELADQQDIRADPLRAMRNVAIRNLTGLVSHAVRGNCSWPTVRELYRDYRSVSVPWTLSDARFYLMDRAVSTAIAIALRQR